MTEREKELREIALAEANYQLESIDWSGIHELDEELTDEEVTYIYGLVTGATPSLPDTPLEENA